MRIAIDYRILVVGPSSIHRGMGRFSQQQLREVLRLDHENEYVLVCYADSDTSLVLPEIAAAPNVEIRRLPPHMRLTGADGESANALRRASAFQDWIDRLGVDLFHATTPFLLEGPILSDFDACPMVATFYDVIPLIFPAQYLTNGPGREYYMRTLGLLHRATRLQSISECSRRDAASYLGFPAARNDLVYPIADPCFSVMEPGRVERRLQRLRAVHGVASGFVLAVSDIHHAKNVETLLQAFALVPPSVRAELPLVISCHLNDPSVRYVQAMADRLGVGDDVVLTGVVSDVELAALYNAATMVVHPSKYEGFGLPVLEAMSCGAPVITTSSSSLPEVARGAAVLVDPEDVWGFSDAMQELHADPGRRRKLADQGLERSAFFTADGLARATLESYRAAAAGTGVPAGRRRVALWTPLPPQRSGIADYSVELLRTLEKTHDVEVFVDDGFLPDIELLRDHRVQHFHAFGRRHRLAPFDAIVYQMGGSTYHLYMYEPLQAVPGIVALHDLMWSHVLLTVANERDDLEGFKRELLALEGQDALDELVAIEDRNGTDPVAAHDDLWTFLSEHPMLGRVIDASVAQVVHFDSARVELEQRYDATRVHTIPMGVSDPVRPGRPLQAAETRARLGLAPSTFVIGVFGIVHPVKRVESCVRALARLVADHPDSVLLVVGEALEPGYVERLAALAAELGVLPHVRFAGYVPRFEFDAQLLCCDAVVNLRAPLTKHMSATLVRGLAAGRPMIVSALADWDFLPEEACMQVPPGDGDAGSDGGGQADAEVDVLARHLATLASDPARRLRMSAAARDYFRREASVEHMAARYAEVIAEGRGRDRGMTALAYNKACEIEDFSHPDLAPTFDEIRPHPPGTDRRHWEMAMAARALQSWGGLHHDAVVLAVGVGPGDMLLHLSRRARQVFATERFHGAGAWRSLAPLALMVEPSLVSAELDASRLVAQHMDERALRFPDDFFDGILCSGSIARYDELQDVANAAYEMGRVLKPGGVLTLSAELQLNGPPGGVGWPGRSLLLSPAHLQRYIVDASGLEPVDDLRSEPSPATLETRRDLARAIVDLDARVVASGSTDGSDGHDAGNLQRLVELEGGYVYTSVQLTLRKTGTYPAVRNGWARASRETLDALALHNRALLAGPRPAPPPDGAVENPPCLPEVADVLVGSWGEIEATHRQRGKLLAAYEHTVTTAADVMVGRRHDIDVHLVELDRTRRDASARLSRLLEEVVEQDRLLAAYPGEDDPASAAGAAAFPVVVSDQVHFDAMVGTEMDDPVAMMLRQGSVCDPTLVALMLQLVPPGERMIDLGAHLGTFALAASAAGGHVLAVEASPRNAELLHASAARNGFTNLRVIHAVASDEPGTAAFYANGPWGHVAGGTMALPVVAVPAVTMDELLAEMGWTPVSLIKLDVEGSEVRVIRSLQKLLEAPDAPPVLFESNGHTLDLFGLTTQDLLGALEGLGYTSHVVEPGRLVPVRALDVQPQTILDCLAFKHRPAALGNWHIDPYMSAAERVERIRADCRHANVAHRRYMAANLARAEPPTLAAPGVVEVLEELAVDPDDAVRTAMRWWSAPDGGSR